MDNLTAIVRLPRGEIQSGLIASELERLNWAVALRRHTRVVLKPNLCCPRPTPGVTTSPTFLRALISALREYSDYVSVVEGDGSFGSHTADEAFRRHGLLALVKTHGINLVNTTNKKSGLHRIVVGNEKLEIPISSSLLDADLFVTAPVPKIHAMTVVSLGLKNQWGCIAGVRRFRFHHRLAEVVVGINKLLRPRLAVFDGRYFLDRSGPLIGDPVRMDLMVIGEMGVAEELCCRIMKIDSHSVEHLRLAAEQGLLPRSLSSDLVSQADLHARSFTLRHTPLSALASIAFRSSLATRIIYESKLAGPLHDVLYLLRGRSPHYPGLRVDGH